MARCGPVKLTNKLTITLRLIGHLLEMLAKESGGSKSIDKKNLGLDFKILWLYVECSGYCDCNQTIIPKLIEIKKDRDGIYHWKNEKTSWFHRFNFKSFFRRHKVGSHIHFPVLAFLHLSVLFPVFQWSFLLTCLDCGGQYSWSCPVSTWQLRLNCLSPYDAQCIL